MRTHLGVRTPDSSPRRPLPTVADLDALTGSRDRVVDVIRLSSLVVVIAGHSLMLTVSADDDGLQLGNLLADVPVMQGATWLLQILPLFFFAGAAAATYGLQSRPSSSTGHWLLARALRLLRPVFWYLLAVVAALLVAVGVGFSTAADVIAHLGVQLLWFLGAYLLVLAVLPMLQRISTSRQLLAVIGACWGATAIIDVLRLAVGVPSVGVLSFLTVWTVPAILGVGYAKRLVSSAQAVVGALVFLAVDILLVVVGPYEVSLVTVPGQQLSNMNPPSLLLAGHTIVLCAGAIALRGPLSALVNRPRIWWWVVVGNRGAMTLYLWHLPVLASIIGAGELAGLGRDQAHPAAFVAIVATQTVLLLALMIPVVALLSGRENDPLPWWDAPLCREVGPLRDRAVLVGMLVVGIATLMMARTGLADDGLLWAAVAVAGAIVSRAIALPRRV
jgi:surface polysaccharide O-acyltransferase-like enzyme